MNYFRIVRIALVMLVSLNGVVRAATPDTEFAWYGRVVSVDVPASTLTLRADAPPHVLRVVDQLKPGQPVSAVWSVRKGMGLALVYLPPIEDMTAVNYGYAVAAEYLRADVPGGTVDLRVRVPAQVASGLSGLTPGSWFKATSARARAANTASVLSLAASAKPEPPPPDEKPKSTATPGLPGPWTIEATLGGTDFSTDCQIAVDGKTLSGKCQNEAGPSDLTGTVDGQALTFSFPVSFSGANFVLVHKGTLEASGLAMNGTLKVLESEVPFTGTKK